MKPRRPADDLSRWDPSSWKGRAGSDFWRDWVPCSEVNKDRFGRLADRLHVSERYRTPRLVTAALALVTRQIGVEIPDVRFWCKR